VGILEVAGVQFRMRKVPLRAVRPFVIRDVALSERLARGATDEEVLQFMHDQVRLSRSLSCSVCLSGSSV
jgi:hypothetical protein